MNLVELRRRVKGFSAPMRSALHRDLVDILHEARYGVFIPNHVPRPITDETVLPREVLEKGSVDRLIQALGYCAATKLRASNSEARAQPHIERAREMAFRCFRRFNIDPPFQMGDGSEYLDDDGATQD